MSLSNKNLAIILTCGAIVLTGITTLLIFITPKPPVQTNDSADIITPRSLIAQPTTPLADESSLAIKSLTETYSIPNANLHYSSHYNSTKGEERIIDQIEVIKDQVVQSKINQEFQSACNNASYAEKSHEDAYSGCYLSITPSNTASLYAYTYSSSPNGPLYSITKNYRLDTGEEIKLDDLFIAGTDLAPILTKAIHEAIHCFDRDCGSANTNAKISDISDIDAEVLRIIQAFRHTKDIPFRFDNQDIAIEIEGYHLSIRMSEWYDKIAIFRRFESPENLFTVEPAAPQFVFSPPTANYKNEFVSDNLFARINTTSYPSNISTPSPILTKQNELIETITKQAIAHVQNKNEIYLLDFYTSIEKHDENYSVSVRVICNAGATAYCAHLYKLPLDQPTKNSAIDFISEAARSRILSGHIYVDDSLDDTSLWPNFDGYTVEYSTYDPAFISSSDIIFYYDASGNPIPKP